MNDFPLPGSGQSVVAVPAPGVGIGNWAGSSSAALDDDGTFVIAYRVRHGQDPRSRSRPSSPGPRTASASRRSPRSTRSTSALSRWRSRRSSVPMMGAGTCTSARRAGAEQALVGRRPGGRRPRGARRAEAAHRVPRRREHRRQGSARATHRRRRLASMDLLPPARRPGRRGPHDHGVRDERRRARVEVARHRPLTASRHVGRARGSRDRGSTRRSRGV